jgi:hypothetical protein
MVKREEHFLTLAATRALNSASAVVRKRFAPCSAQALY